MAFAPLSLQEYLRPWQAAGLSHLLLEKNVPLPVAPSATVNATGGAAFVQTDVVQTSKKAPVSSAQTAPPSQNAAFAPQTSARPTPRQEVTLLPKEAWPGIWLRQYSRFPERPAVLWTYPALGRDLECTPDSGRRELLRQLLQPLNLPKGSSAFLPCLLPDMDAGAALPDSGQVSGAGSGPGSAPDSAQAADSSRTSASAQASGSSQTPTARLAPGSPQALDGLDFVPNAGAFWSIVKTAAPKVLILFGQQALQAVLPGQNMRFYQQGQHLGVHLVLLPDIFAEEGASSTVTPSGSAASGASASGRPPVGALAAYLSTVLANILRQARA